MFSTDNASRPLLTMTGTEGSDYINASFVDVREASSTAMVQLNCFSHFRATSSVKAT